MARLIEMPGAAGPLNEGERRAVQALLTNLPDGYWVAGGVEIAEPGGQSFDYDAIVVAPHAVYVVEIKDWRGDIIGDEREWLVGGDERRAPLLTTQRKARVLKSRLAGRMPALGRVWVEAAVVLASSPRSIRLTPEAQLRTFSIGDLVRFVADPARIGKPEGGIQDLVGPILRFFTAGVARRLGGPLRFGNYEVVETLDQQEGEAWYRARHRLLAGVPLVRLHVVTLSAYALSEEQRQARQDALLRETNALLMMGSHPNVIAARETFVDDANRIVVVFDDTPGRSLRQRLLEGTPMTMQERLNVLHDVAEALAHAHAHKVVHRQVEPQSIMLGDNGAARLARFGLAKLLDIPGAATVWHDDTVEGLDRRYLAPELVNGALGTVSPATDLYALGCVTYELLAGRPPFEDPLRAFEGMPELPEGAPPALTELLPHLLAPQPEARPPRIDPFLAALRQAQSGARPKRVTGPKRAYQAGDLIDDDFAVRERLGGGGFSDVYRVYRALDDQEYALKVFNVGVEYDKVQREIITLRQIDNPHVVRAVWASRTYEKQWYLVTELIDGEPLAEYARGTKRLSAAEAVRLICQVLSALEAIHPDVLRIAELRRRLDDGEGEVDDIATWQRLQGEGIVHRDIKPENLMLTGDGVKLIDFNIASRVGDRVQTLSGTPPYMPPDVLAGHDRWEVSPDLFATGVVLYELLCYEHPYPDNQPRPDRYPRDPREMRPDLSPELASFLLRACAPYSADRFPSALVMRKSLEAIDPLIAPVVPPSGLSPELRALLAGATPDTNPLVLAFLALSSQARRTNRGTRGLDSLAAGTYVETKLDGELAASVLQGRHGLVIVTGNAGDGKTAFIQQVEAEALGNGAVLLARGANGCTLRYATRQIHTLYDGSQDEDDRSSDEVLIDFLAPFADGAPTTGDTRLAAINEGRLRDFLLAHRERFGALAHRLIAALDAPEAPRDDGTIVLVNLNLRSVTAGGRESIFSRQLAAIVRGPFWAACEPCAHRERCPLKHNVDTFRDATSGDEAAERLRTLVDVVRLRRRRHLTMRDIRSLIAHILFRDRACEEVPALFADDDPHVLLDLAYFQAVGGLGGPVGSSLERGAALLAEIDVALVSNPADDRALARGRTPRLMDFPARERGYPAELIRALRERAGSGYEGDAAKARRAHQAARRHLFFERGDDGWRSMLPYGRLLMFQEALEGSRERQAEIRSEAIQAISRYEGYAKPDESLWIATGTAGMAGLRSFRRFPTADFELQVATVAAPYIEAAPDRLRLIHSPSGTVLELTLDLYEVLERLRDGFVPSAEEGRGFLINIDLFKQRLLALTTTELLIVGDELHMRIVRAGGGRVELKEDRP